MTEERCWMCPEPAALTHTTQEHRADPERFNVDPHVLAKTTDPETSHAAARSLGAGAASMRARVLRAFLENEPMTAEEVSNFLGVEQTVAGMKRVSDLLNAGFLEPTGATREGTSGRQQRVLRPTPAGRRALTPVAGDVADAHADPHPVSEF